MTVFAAAFALVVALLLGSLVAFLRGRNRDLPSQDVIDRVKAREREIEARERAQNGSDGEPS
jgi:hypothetical protein